MTDELNKSGFDSKTLLRMAPHDIFTIAAERSGIGRDAIGKEMGWSKGQIGRVFGQDDYFSKFSDIPKFCSVVENTLVISWLQVQALHFGATHNASATDCVALIQRVGELFSETGDVGQVAKSALEDGKIDLQEYKKLMREVSDVINSGAILLSELRAGYNQLKDSEAEAEEC
ncbi:MAG: phage regulatory CII family protein [Desulfovibrio sp.]